MLSTLHIHALQQGNINKLEVWNTMLLLGSQGQGHMTVNAYVSWAWPKEHAYQIWTMYLEQIQSYRQAYSLLTDKQI